ncbi:hypothetical protein ASG92_21325 [Arthrobacter sp. Soil736]|nr:hypothetical protein ASG92_21325 [Arthrobacter sp. Soil736]
MGELDCRVGARERTLSRLFRNEVGMTYTVSRNQLRLHLAKLMLAGGRVSPMQIEAPNHRQDRLINAVRDRRRFRYSLSPSTSPPAPVRPAISRGRAGLFLGWKFHFLTFRHPFDWTA